MSSDRYNPYSIPNVCQALVNRGLISQTQALAILRKKSDFEKRIEILHKERSALSVSGLKSDDFVTIIDVIAPLKLPRADDVLKSLDEDAIYQALAKTWEVPYKKIDPLKLDLNMVTTTIPHSFALRHLILPISVRDGILTVATSNPFNVEAMDDIARVSQLQVQAVVSSKKDITKIIDEFFCFKRSIVAAEHQFTAPLVDLGNLEQFVHLKSADELPSNDQHIVNAVNHLLVSAFDQRASDIHIEPKRSISLVRLRIDGVLHTVYELPKNVHSAIVSRIKNMSRLNMAEKRKPQDGRIKTDKSGVEVEIRVSTVPVAFGEKVVMRIMNPEVLFQNLDNLGFTPEDLARYNQFITIPHGIVLVCGPTGSGKSTTLYSSLQQLSSPEVNITTVEDPIEMIHEDFNQIGVQPAVGVTFATILRHILRQDPDIIMIGELRDLETAKNAVQAALTGHLVLSTLHTNDAPSSITRLVDLGVSPFLIRATLIGILSQRLVRKICPHCIESFVIDTVDLKAMGLDLGQNGGVKLFQGKGCQKCRGTGYYGRTGIFEVLPYTPSIRKLTTLTTDLDAIISEARREGMLTLRESAIQKLLQGKTTYQEVLKVTWAQA